MIEVESLSKSYGDFTALQDASFTIGREHGITALLGPNGAGKTTTLRLLTGYLNPTKGKVRVNGTELSAATHVSVKKQIGYLPETTPLYGEMLVSEYLQFMAQSRGLEEAQVNKQCREMVDKLELKSHLYTPLALLSKGFRQRVALAATLVHEPQYIILDEPTSGLDPNQIQQIRELIRSLGKKQTLLLSTHILQEVEDICDRVIILSRGKVVADESTSILRSVQACRLVLKGRDIQKTLSSMEIVKECRLAAAQGDAALANLPEGYEIYVCELKEDSPEKLFAQIASQGWEVRELAPLSRSLQDVFHELTS